MVGNRKYEFNSFLIKSIMPTEQGISVVGDSKEQEDIVYHYTSPDAFLSIIQNQAIRFTDIRYLNDKSEGIYFVKLLLEFRDKNKGKYPYFEEAINALLIDNDAEKIKNLEVTHIKFSEIPYMPYKAERIFVFCTCTEADSLNMWNYYVNNGAYQGYNIGFKINEFLKTFDTPQQNQADSFAVYYGKVLYSSSNQTREIRYFVNGIEREIEKEAEKGSDAIGRAIKYAQLKIRSYIDSHGAFYKDSKFRSEEEFRIVIEIANDRVPRKKEDAQKYFGANNKKLLSSDLYIAQISPCKLVGNLRFDPTNNIHAGPALDWYLLALPPDQENEVDIDYRAEPWNSETTILRVHENRKQHRPHLSSTGFATKGEILRLNCPTPVTDTVYDWLESDLKAIGWIVR